MNQWQINIDHRYEISILYVGHDGFELYPDGWSSTWDSAYNVVKSTFDYYPDKFGTKVKSVRIFDRMARRGQPELWTFYPDRNGNFDRHNVVGEHKD